MDGATVALSMTGRIRPIRIEGVGISYALFFFVHGYTGQWGVEFLVPPGTYLLIVSGVNRIPD